MSNNESNQKLLSVLMAGMILIVITMIVSVFIATRRPVVVMLPGSGATAAPTAGAASTTDPGGSVGAPTASEVAPPEVNVASLSTVPALNNPLDPAWEQIAGNDIPLQPQQVAEPTLVAPTVATVKVQSAHDANRYVWRLSWSQPNPTATSDFGQFSDAVAIQFPLADGAPYTMGGPNLPVVMLYWKAIWQKDQDEGFQDTTATKPNAYSDFYWFAQETGPISADKLALEAQARQWMVAAASGNPMSDFQRGCPMEELAAQGFGTTTHVAETTSQARGKWDNGKWYVVFERPNNDSDKLIARFKQNPQQQLVAFAVWDGAAENRGGKKHISNWVPLRIK